jgi:hypothetical protein
MKAKVIFSTASPSVHGRYMVETQLEFRNERKVFSGEVTDMERLEAALEQESIEKKYQKLWECIRLRNEDKVEEWKESLKPLNFSIRLRRDTADRLREEAWENARTIAGQLEVILRERYR